MSKEGMPDAWMLAILKRATNAWLVKKSKILFACGIRKDPRLALNQQESARVIQCLQRASHEINTERKQNGRHQRQ